MLSLLHLCDGNPAAKNYVRLDLSVLFDRLCGLVVRVLGYRSGGPGSIPGTTRDFLGRGNSSGSGIGSIQPREYN
jgi:hypothetical protein